jgi:hypothetical protein
MCALDQQCLKAAAAAVHNLRLQNSYEKLSKMMQGLGVANPAELKRKTRRFARFLGYYSTYSSLSLLSSNKQKKKTQAVLLREALFP